MLNVGQLVEVEPVPEGAAVVRHRGLEEDPPLRCMVVRGVAHVLHEPEAQKGVGEEAVAEGHGEDEVGEGLGAPPVEAERVDGGGGQHVAKEEAELAAVAPPVAEEAGAEGGAVEGGEAGAHKGDPEEGPEGRVEGGGRALPGPEEGLPVNVPGRPRVPVVPLVPALATEDDDVRRAT